MLPYLFYLIAYPLLLMCCIFLGRRRAGKAQKRQHQWKATGLENGLMGFFALLTSFTLVQTGNYANERNGMIHSIAADMSEILRATKTDPPQVQARVKQYFSDFYQIIKQPIPNRETLITERIQKIDRMDDVFDADLGRYIAAQLIAKDRVGVLLEKTDRMESKYYRLMHSYNKTLPQMILFILVLFSLFIGFLVGFIEKYNGNHIRIISVIFVIISFLTLNVIHDLDNPSIGFLKPNFQDLGEVMNSFHLQK